MSKADKMFKELEYEKSEFYNCGEVINYHKEGYVRKYAPCIAFDGLTHHVLFKGLNDGVLPGKPCDGQEKRYKMQIFIAEPKLIEAINEKVKELGWIK